MADPAPSKPCYDVVVVGAGIAGLAAAAKLHSSGISSIAVCEATDRIGGRVRQVHGVMPWPVEEGPEFVHGGRTCLTDILQQLGCQLREKAWPDAWYHAKGQAQDADLEAVRGWMDDIGSCGLSGTAPDQSVADWLRSKGASPGMLSIADACYANDFGCSLEDLGLRECILENQRWDAGESYLLLDRSLQALINHIARPVRKHILTSWPVNSIAQPPHPEGLLTLHGPGGQQLVCRRVIVSVPLPVLQRGQLSFSPALPQRKQQALARLHMGNAVKVMLAFSRRFWAPQVWDVVCTDSFIPEFWSTVYPPAHAHSQQQEQADLHSPRPAPALHSIPQPRDRAADSTSPGATLGHCTHSLPAASQRTQPSHEQQHAGPLFNASPEMPTALQRAGAGAAPAQQPAGQSCSSTGASPAAQRRARHISDGYADNTSLFGLVGFVCGRKADVAAALGHEGIVARALEQLDTMHGTADDPRPASKAFIRGHTVDWSQQPFVWGAYSHPSLGAQLGDREALGAPLAGRLFFAGEATHPAVNPCLQAAFETGERAAHQALVSLQRSHL